MNSGSIAIAHENLESSVLGKGLWMGTSCRLHLVRVGVRVRVGVGVGVGVKVKVRVRVRVRNRVRDWV